MERFDILSSKKLSKSFRKIEGHNTWENLGLTQGEVNKMFAAALNKMTKRSKPLTITVTRNE